MDTHPIHPTQRPRLPAVDHPAEWLGVPGIQRTLADALDTSVRRVWRRLVRRSTTPVAACCT